MRVRPLAAGTIDALVASEPTPSLAESRGAHPLATLGGMGNVSPILIVARTRVLEQHPDRAVKFLKGLVKAAAFVKTHPDETAELLSTATGLKPELVKEAMARHSYSLTLDESIFKSLEQTAHFLESKKRIKEIPDFETVIDAQHLQQAR